MFGKMIMRKVGLSPRTRVREVERGFVTGEEMSGVVLFFLGGGYGGRKG